MKLFDLVDGRDFLFQWDTNRYINVPGTEEVHFVQSYVQMDVAVSDGKARIPDEMLQSAVQIKAYAYVTADGNFTRQEKNYNIKPREKPSGYIYTPTEVLNFEQLQRQIGDLEDLSTEAKENLVAAINEIVAGGADYDNLINRPQINGHTLTGDKTPEQLGIREIPAASTADAGKVATVGADGKWKVQSLPESTIDYEDLENQPKVNGHTLIGDQTAEELDIREVPEVSALDNGKVLKVKNGAWSPETMSLVWGAILGSIGNQTDLMSLFNAITAKIPNQASAANQLADKDFVNSSIQNVAAFYITKNAAGDPFATKAELNAATVFYSGGVVRVPTRNDYCVVLADESKTIAETGENPTTRYIYGTNSWSYQYIVNRSGLTAAQWAAVNSGITAAIVALAENAQQGTKLNGTSIVDGDGIAQIPLATASVYGAVKGDTSKGVGITSGVPAVQKATDTEITNKSNQYKPIVPANLDKAVMEGLGNNDLSWSDAYKSSAREKIGAGVQNDTQIDGSSVMDGDTAKIHTMNGDYDDANNKLATANDILANMLNERIWQMPGITGDVKDYLGNTIWTPAGWITSAKAASASIRTVREDRPALWGQALNSLKAFGATPSKHKRPVLWSQYMPAKATDETTYPMIKPTGEKFVKDIGLDGTGSDFGYYNEATGVFVKAQGAVGTVIQPISYAESDGTAYVETGILANINTKAEITFKTSDATAYQGIFGARTSAATPDNVGVLVGPYEGVTRVITDFGEYTNGRAADPNAVSTELKYKAVLSRTGRYIYNTETGALIASNTNIITASFTSANGLRLFDMYGNSASAGLLKGNVYACKIWDNDTLVRDYQPVRVGTSQVELLDLVSWTFATRNGTFTAGEDVNLVPDVIKVNTGDLYYENGSIHTDGEHKLFVGSQGVVDLGTLTWSTNQSAYPGVFSASVSNRNTGSRTNLYLYGFTASATTGWNVPTNCISGFTDARVFINDPNAVGLTAAEFKTYMSGKYLFYQRSTDTSFIQPEVRDIPTLYSANSFVDIQKASNNKHEEWACIWYDGTQDVPSGYISEYGDLRANQIVLYPLVTPTTETVIVTAVEPEIYKSYTVTSEAEIETTVQAVYVGDEFV